MSTRPRAIARGNARTEGHLRALRDLWRAQGSRGVARAVIGRVYQRDDFVILQRDLQEQVPPLECRVDFTLRQLDDATLESFRHRPYPFSRHHEYRFRHGQRRCYGAVVGDRIAALMWPSFAIDNRRVVSPWRRLWPDEARIGSIWADPEYRGTGLMGACIGAFAGYLGRRGFRYLYACTWGGNQASIRLHERLGFRAVGRATRHAFTWQAEGRGFYVRTRIPRAPLAPGHPGGDADLPEVLG
ncbi:MAG: GNAT family N-acetyltransferase [Candidatus Rokubacteria bacterium]|nr:GNAT family N-acetyltransferase [Candidatus Rokubacteria bacterium]